MGCLCTGTSNTEGNKRFTETKNKFVLPQMYPLDLNWAEVNSSQIGHTISTKELLCNAWLSWLSSLFLDTFLAGGRPGRPSAAALSVTAVSALRRQTGAGAWQRQRAHPGLNRHGNSITLGGGPSSAGRGSFSCWGWSRKEAATVLAELPVGIDWLFSIAEVLNWGKNNLDVQETDESYCKHTITAVHIVSRISRSCIWLIIWDF